ncbi:hypothetical protein AMTR_s00001p00186030 [Amborella trichopoda]|uniref:Prolamin-like domain-containing protein n=1 Tax=Amborella trichopoda TaxID=13333 RepID=W1NM49_AMBTC|nr:hypothetical protein AMTR_s00001p00186030 [Amborella trichopoda]
MSSKHMSLTLLMALCMLSLSAAVRVHPANQGAPALAPGDVPPCFARIIVYYPDLMRLMSGGALPGEGFWRIISSLSEHCYKSMLPELGINVELGARLKIYCDRVSGFTPQLSSS